MKKIIIIVLVLAAVGVGAGAFYMRRGGPEPRVDTLQITRGDITDVVPATGILEAVETVDVGTQVSGMVQELYADFNSIVRKGQVIARLDPSLIQTSIETQRANVDRALADLDRLKVNLADSRRKLEQAKQMWAKQLIPRDQLDTAELNVKNAESQIKSSEAGLVQARAALNTQQVNLGHTVIRSPIDGIVISRNVDPGQTVASSMNAPTLYVIAADLTKMQVIASIDEAEVGKIRPGQPVSFRVDAYPNDQFRGNVEQVRLQPTTVQNVVTYSTVVSVANPEYKLKPGMTANLTVEIARRDNVLRIPAAALRFRPNADMFAALNLPVPPEVQRGQGAGGFAGRGREGGRGGQGGPAGAGPAAGQPAPSSAPQAGNAARSGQPTAPQQPRPDPSAGSGSPRAESRGERVRGEGGRGGDPSTGSGRGGRGGFDPNMTSEERRKRMEERMANMTPEERERFQQRMREFGGRGRGPGGESGVGRQSQSGGSDGAPSTGSGASRAESRDAARPSGTRQDSNPGRLDASRGITQRAEAGSAVTSGATTIDALFAPVPAPESRGRVWLWFDKQLKPVSIRYGVSDGTWSELIEGDLKEGQEVVTNITTGLEVRPPAGQGGGSQNPLMGPQRGRGGPSGGSSGGSRGGGR
jgi:HlyD family secretion protein